MDVGRMFVRRNLRGGERTPEKASPEENVFLTSILPQETVLDQHLSPVASIHRKL